MYVRNGHLPAQFTTNPLQKRMRMQMQMQMRLMRRPESCITGLLYFFFFLDDYSGSSQFLQLGITQSKFRGTLTKSRCTKTSKGHRVVLLNVIHQSRQSRRVPGCQRPSKLKHQTHFPLRFSVACLIVLTVTLGPSPLRS